MRRCRKGLNSLYILLYLIIGASILACGSPLSAEYAYDPNADPAVTYQQAIQQASEQQKLVLLVFGSEWCPDCRSLNKKMAMPPLSDTLTGYFVVAHIDIGNWDRNMAFVAQFGKPVAKGIPSIAIIAPDKRVLYVSEGGEFASARSAGLSGLDNWFKDRLHQLGKD
jgi:thiol-disulfide isomerase/thioredoxin